MIDFTGLLLPFLVVASLVSGVAVTDLQSLYIDTITVPDSMTKRGFTPTVFIRMVNDDLLSIEAEAKTRTDAQKLRTENEKGVIAVMLDMLNMTALVRAVQESSNLIEFTVNGEIVESGNDYLLRLRLERYGHSVTRIEVSKPQDTLDALAAAAAERVMKITDPQVVCAAVMQREAGSQTASAGLQFPKTNACIAETMVNAQRDDRLWLLNLEGVVAFVAGDQEAAKRHFRQAVREDSDFSPALLNLGIIEAHNQRYAKAIRYYQQVFRRELPVDSPQTYAATYTEWGDALSHLGQQADAETAFRMATEADPRYSEAYLRWANHTTNRQEAAKLEALAKQIGDRYGEVYTDNLVGKLRLAAEDAKDRGASSSAADEGTLGDVGLLAEPAIHGNIFERLRSAWRNL
jgi:tetratricopeptide (TPR) repeat protein